MNIIRKVIRVLSSKLLRIKQFPLAYYYDIHAPFSNYIYKGVFKSENIIVDVGCADDPDLSIYMIKNFGLNSIAIDPTLKHRSALKKLEQECSNFKYLPYAISNKSGKLTFYESLENTSGSILLEHTNIVNDRTTSYEVDSITLKELSSIVGRDIDLLKLDLEGAEYELLMNIDKSDLLPYKQIFVEFHHHCTKYTQHDTTNVVRRLKVFGFKEFSLDRHNYLFYWH